MSTFLPLTVALMMASPMQGRSIHAMMRMVVGQHGVAVTVTGDQRTFTPLSFTGSYRMEVHTYKNGREGKDSPANIFMAFNSDKMVMVPQVGNSAEEMRMVFDLRNEHTYTLMTDGKGQRTGIKMKMMQVDMDGGAGAYNDVKVVRTDATQVIEGHTCRKYTYSDKEGQGEAWIAEDLDFDMMGAFRRMLGAQGAEDWQRIGTTGVVMENTWTSADGKEKVVMYTKDLMVGEVDEDLFSTSGFEVQDMTAIPMMGR